MRDTNIDSQVEDLDLTDDEMKIVEAVETETGTSLSLPIVRPTRFSYAGVSQAWIEEAEATADRILNRIRGSIVETGRDLANIKDKLDHVDLGKWLAHYFHMSERTAQNYMNTAKKFGATPQILDLVPHGTVYRLAADSTPDEVRKAVVGEIVAGTRPGLNQLEKRIADSKEVERQKKQEKLAGEAAERAKQSWEKKENALRKSGASEADIDVARKNWDTKKAQDKVKKPQVPESSKQSAEHEREEAEKRREHSRKLAAQVVAALKKRYGAQFPKLRELIERCGIDSFERALRDA